MHRNQPQLIALPRIEDIRGNLSFIEEGNFLPFTFERMYWIYDVPGGQVRGSHAFHTQHEFMIALSGSFDIVIHDGEQEHRFSLNRSYKGVYLPPLMWRTLENFSSNAVCLVVNSGPFLEEEYIWDFEQFIHLISLTHETP